MRLAAPVRHLLAGVFVLTATIGGCKTFVARPFLSLTNGGKSAHRLHKSQSLLSCGVESPALPPALRLRCCSGEVRRRTCLHDMTSSSAFSHCVRAAKRRSSTALNLNSSGSGGVGGGGGAGGGGGEGGGGGQGPGTQQLSRQAKLAISVLIDLIGMSSFALPGVGEVGVVVVPCDVRPVSLIYSTCDVLLYQVRNMLHVDVDETCYSYDTRYRMITINEIYL